MDANRLEEVLSQLASSRTGRVTVGVGRIPVLQAQTDRVILAANRNQNAIKVTFLREWAIALGLRPSSAGKGKQFGRDRPFLPLDKDAANRVVVGQPGIDLVENLLSILWWGAPPDFVQPSGDFRQILKFDACGDLRMLPFSSPAK